LPEHVWLKVFGYLSPSRSRTLSILNVHLTCRKFHDLASLVPCDLYLISVLSSEGNVEAFKKSKRIYDTINFVEFGALSDIQLRPAIALLEPTRVHVKELRIRYGYLSKSDVVRLLKLFPNLEKLSLQDIYPTQDPSQELGTISLPKLTDITTGDCYIELDDLVKDFRDCSITDFNSILLETLEVTTKTSWL
jgi:hypothetical protein